MCSFSSLLLFILKFLDSIVVLHYTNVINYLQFEVVIGCRCRWTWSMHKSLFIWVFDWIQNNWHPPWERGEVCQVSTIDTEFNILEMEASLVQRKCMEASKGEAVMPLNLAKSKKNKMIDKARSVVIQWLGSKNLWEKVVKVTTRITPSIYEVMVIACGTTKSRWMQG